MKGRGPFLYALSVYSLISSALMGAQFLCAGALVFLLYRLSHLGALSALPVFRSSYYDSAGFAFLAATNTALQYYLASLLSLDESARGARFGVVAVSAVFSTALFLRLSAGASFGAYSLAWAPMLFSYMLGGFCGALQDERENPFLGVRPGIFGPG